MHRFVVAAIAACLTATAVPALAQTAPQPVEADPVSAARVATLVQRLPLAGKSLEHACGMQPDSTTSLKLSCMLDMLSSEQWRQFIFLEKDASTARRVKACLEEPSNSTEPQKAACSRQVLDLISQSQ